MCKHKYKTSTDRSADAKEDALVAWGLLRARGIQGPSEARLALRGIPTGPYLSRACGLFVVSELVE